MRLLYFLCCCFSISVFGQSTKELYNLSTKAYKEKDFVTFLKLTKQLDSIRPSHPTYTYNLACAHALNNNSKESISVLKKCVLMNNTVDIETENDLQSVKSNVDFSGLLDLKSELYKPISNSKKVVQLSEKDLHPESVLYLKKSKTWLATSIRNRKIVSFDIKSGKCINWLNDKELLSVFAMKADVKEQFIWVATSAIPEMKGYSSALESKSEVLKIDIKTKKIIQRFTLEGNHTFGDLLVAKNGDVYISDSGEAKIFKISKDEMSIWLDVKEEAFNLQGLCFNQDESQLFIADYLKGILRINFKNPSDRKWLKFPTGSVEKGIDGLQFYKNSLLAIQNGVKPIRILKFLLNESCELVSFKVLDHNRSEFNEPTNGLIFNNDFYFIGNSPWSAYDKNFNLDENKHSNPVLYKNSLNAIQ